MLGQCGFPAAVMTKDHHKGPLLNGKIQMFKHTDRICALYLIVEKGRVLYVDGIFHIN